MRAEKKSDMQEIDSAPIVGAYHAAIQSINSFIVKLIRYYGMTE